jgi:hypothetical protein
MVSEAREEGERKIDCGATDGARSRRTGALAGNVMLFRRRMHGIA